MKKFLLPIVLATIFLAGCGSIKAPVSEIPTPAQENRTNTPVEIKSMVDIEGGVILKIDILSPNPNFLPGENDFFINQNTKLREVQFTTATKIYKCGAGPDNNQTSADVPYAFNDFIHDLRERLPQTDVGPLIFYFDIENGRVINVYEQCLP